MLTWSGNASSHFAESHQYFRFTLIPRLRSQSQLRKMLRSTPHPALSRRERVLLLSLVKVPISPAVTSKLQALSRREREVGVPAGVRETHAVAWLRFDR